MQHGWEKAHEHDCGEDILGVVDAGVDPVLVAADDGTYEEACGEAGDDVDESVCDVDSNPVCKKLSDLGKCL